MVMRESNQLSKNLLTEIFGEFDEKLNSTQEVPRWNTNGN